MHFFSTSLIYLFLLCLYNFSNVSGFSDQYYGLVKAINEGENLYDRLGATSSDDKKILKKLFRKLSVKHHPDRVTENIEEEKEIYEKIVFAYNILSDEETKQEYDDLLLYGIPWEAQYYGRYAHDWGAPEHDIKHVLLVLITIITILHYWYLYSRYWKNKRYIEMIKENDKKLKENEKMKSMSKKEKKKYKRDKTYNTTTNGDNNNNNGEENNDTAEEDDEYVYSGMKKPGWKDLFVIRLILFPYTFSKYFYVLFYDIYRATVLGVDVQKEYQEKRIMEYRQEHGYDDDEEWDRMMKKQEQRRERLLNSNKYKRYKKYMKKYG